MLNVPGTLLYLKAKHLVPGLKNPVTGNHMFPNTITFRAHNPNPHDSHSRFNYAYNSRTWKNFGFGAPFVLLNMEKIPNSNKFKLIILHKTHKYELEGTNHKLNRMFAFADTWNSKYQSEYEEYVKLGIIQILEDGSQDINPYRLNLLLNQQK